MATSDLGPQSSNDGKSELPEPRASARPKRPRRDPLVNAIYPSRTPKKEPVAAAAPAEAAAPAPASQVAEKGSPAQPLGVAAPSSEMHRADADQWTVPQSVRDRFVQDGHRFYFPDGVSAFRDLGHRLTTSSENSQVVHSLIQIAHSRGWTELTVRGTERFRQEAWRQARLSGLAVRGYRPSDPEQAALIRAMARNLAQPASTPTDAISAEAQASNTRAPSASALPVASGATTGRASRERIAGRLLEHGRDAYRHDPKEEISYFVSVQTREGKREIWGKDLERAMTKSLTQPQIGDEVILQQTGRDTVTVTRAERDADGNLKPKDVETHRNRWVIEKGTFFAERAAAAQVFRDATIDPRTAVRDHPELAGTYLNLRAGELAAQRLRDPEDRRRFVALLRSALAHDIERGEPLQPVRLRERAATVERRVPREADRAPTR